MATGPDDPNADYLGYQLGTAATTKNPPPQCTDPRDAWTGQPGPGITVFVNAYGPATVSITVTMKSGAVKMFSATEQPGDTVHQFDEPSINPAQVSKVLIDAGTSPQYLGGKCYATGGPNA